MKQQFKVILGVIFLILFVIVALQNVNPVSVDLFVAKYQVPLILLILLSALLGMIVGLLVTISSNSRQRKEVKRLNNEIKSLKDQHTQDIIKKDDQISDLKAKVSDLKDKNKNTQVYQEDSFVKQEMDMPESHLDPASMTPKDLPVSEEVSLPAQVELPEEVDADFTE
ncbi:LapA family protein [Eremococcus coleocola]|uniref:LapA family protein n=1 Tax=Eremococcus coleocola TaxID=88132 RepID=UPI00040EFAA5|nr:LapA family protein [Eremococcus coleocola]